MVEENPMKGVPPKVVKLKEELSCELNDVEWQNRARELADAHRETEVQKQRKKDIGKELTADVSVAEGKETKLANIVSTRREMREVVVEVKYDYELGKVTKIRTDTDELISEREMTDDERHEQMELVDANDVIESRHEDENGDPVDTEEQ